MMSIRASVVILILLFSGSLRAQTAVTTDFGADPKAAGTISSSSNRTISQRPAPFEFIPNRGQLSDKFGNPVSDVQYYSHSNGLTIYYTSSGMHFYFTKVIRAADKPRDRIQPPLPHDPRGDTLFSYRIDLNLVGANPSASIQPQAPQAEFANYYIPRFPNGLTDVPSYAGLLYRDIYPNIDMRIYGTEKGMKYDFIVRPGGDAGLIRMHYSGADSLRLSNGKLEVFNPFGLLQEDAPVSYQQSNVTSAITSDPLQQIPIASNFLLHGSEVTFEVGQHDHTQELIIDPPRVWGTYFGGSSYDYFFGDCIDNSDNIYATGTVLSPGFGTAGTFQDTLNTLSGYTYDGIVAKFTPSGNRVWSTYFGAGLTDGWTLAIDPSRNVILEGFTFDDTSIASPGAYQTVLNNQVGNRAWDGYIAKFDSSGHRIWSTYFGSSDTDYIYNVAVDSSSNILIAGYTSSTSGIASPGAFKMSRTRTAPNDYGGFVAKFSPSGSRLWSTYYGDTVTECLGVCATPNDEVVVSGLTVCKSGITTSNVYQSVIQNYVAGILVKFNAAGTRLWGTYVDGTTTYYGSELYRVASAPGGKIYTCGVSWNPSGLGTPGAYRNAITYGFDASILQIFDGSGNRLAGTYFGDSYRSEVAFNVTVAPDGLPVIAGWTTDSTHIASPGAFYSAVNDTDVSFIGKFGLDCSRKWGTYFTGTSHVGVTWDIIYGLAVDHKAHPIIAGVTGSSTGIATAGAFQTSFNGIEDGFLVKFCDTLLSPLHFAGDSITCFGAYDTLVAPSGFASYQWRLAGNPISGATASRYAVPLTQAPGVYRYTVDIADPTICTSITDTLKLLIRALPSINAGADKAICLNSSVQIGSIATGGLAPYHYLWVPDSGLSSAIIATPIASPKKTTRYIEIVTDSNGCQAQDTVIVTVRALPSVIAPNDIVICVGNSSIVGANATGGTGPYTYAWTPTLGLSATNISQPIASPKNSTTYRVHVTDANGCDNWDTINVVVTAAPSVSIVPTGPVSLCVGDSVILSATSGMSSYIWSSGELVSAIKVKSAGKYVVAVTDANGCSVRSDTVFVSLVAKPNPSIFGPNSACPQSITTYSASVDSSGHYMWTLSGGGNIASGNGTNAVTVNWATAGTWTLTVRDSNLAGCTKDTSITVTIGTTLSPIITPAGPITLCNGDTTILHAAKGFTSYAWSNGATSDSILVTKSASYSVTVVGAGGCAGTSLPVVVNVIATPKPQPKLTALTTQICQGDSVRITTTQSYTSYQWSNGATTPAVMVSTAGTYFVRVTNSDGCTGTSDSVSIVVNPIPIVTVSHIGPLVRCAGDSVQLIAISGGASYLWSDGETSSSINAKTSGDYTVTMKNAAGCSATSQPVHVTVSSISQITITGPASVCTNSTTNYSVTAASGSMVRWTISGGTIASGQSTNAITVNWGGAGTATISVSENDTTTGCSGSDTLTVTIDNSLVPIVTASGPIIFCEGDSVTLDAGAGYASYQWLRAGVNVVGATSEKLVVNTSGDYSVFVTNSGSCQGTSKFTTVKVNPTPNAPVISLTGATLSSTLATTYQWSLNGTPITGATKQGLSSLVGGDYTVLITDANGCSNISLPFTYIDSGHTVVALPKYLSANPTEQVKLPITLVSSQNIPAGGVMTYTAQIRFNKTLLAPSGVTPLGVIVGNDLVVTVSGNNPLPLGTSSGTIATLDFLATLGNDTCTDISIDAFTWTADNISVTRQSGRFCLTGVCETGGTIRLLDPNAKLSLSQTHPNPASTQTQVEYDLSEQGETKLFITDIMGKEVKQIVAGVQLSGHYTATFDLSGLAQGTYIYVLQTPTQKLSHLMQIRR
jgi:hypothetical protein